MSDNNEIRECLKRCTRWLGRLVAVNSYLTEDGVPVVLERIAGADKALLDAESITDNDESSTTELLGALGVCVPWMYTVVDGGYNEGCASPKDAPRALAQANDIIARNS